jgi:hypothetical protein
MFRRISEMAVRACTGMDLGVGIMILDGLRGVLISSGGLRDYRLGVGRCRSEKSSLA